MLLVYMETVVGITEHIFLRDQTALWISLCAIDTKFNVNSFSFLQRPDRGLLQQWDNQNFGLNIWQFKQNKSNEFCDIF